MCYLVYTNFQRQGAVANMTVAEVQAATKSREYRVISVWEHKTTNSHGAAKLAIHIKVYQLLQRFIIEKEGSDLVFTTSNGEKVTHISVELDKLAEAFGKKFSITPTLNRKQIATVIGNRGTEAEERDAASHMSHSLEIHRASYQHKGGVEQSVSRFVTRFLNFYLPIFLQICDVKQCCC